MSATRRSGDTTPTSSLLTGARAALLGLAAVNAVRAAEVILSGGAPVAAMILGAVSALAATCAATVTTRWGPIAYPASWGVAVFAVVGSLAVPLSARPDLVMWLASALAGIFLAIALSVRRVRDAAYINADVNARTRVAASDPSTTHGASSLVLTPGLADKVRLVGLPGVVLAICVAAITRGEGGWGWWTGLILSGLGVAMGLAIVVRPDAGALRLSGEGLTMRFLWRSSECAWSDVSEARVVEFAHRRAVGLAHIAPTRVQVLGMVLGGGVDVRITLDYGVEPDELARVINRWRAWAHRVSHGLKSDIPPGEAPHRETEHTHDPDDAPQ